ncbi:HNH endonuclease [Quadrisphaera setariae]|uniref:HNH endonuclease n=1 Tax=Quadrisphaera setariae TaxID=2593304 RepID=A0A5C8ZFU1_9ACTN|nr:HNH endonuclease [Quadrisphaera setariae]TXR56707.1 HNH endonuclease [Quadrisphaera setariae]
MSTALQPGGQPSHQAGRAERLALAVARQGGRCLWCGRRFGPLVPATTDHLVPRVKGGPSWVENEVAACSRCNGQRGHTTPADWFEECGRRGWHPDAAALRAALDALEVAIAARGGQRRARPYLAAQRRRLARAAPVDGPRGAEGWQTRRP